MVSDELYNLEPAVKKIIQDFNGLLEWKPDNWVKSSLAEFVTDQQENIEPILKRHLPHKWNNETLTGAPDSIRNIADRIGGVKGGQLLLASEPDQQSFIFGAWWPWNNGQKISIRLAPFSVNFSQEEMEEFIRVFQSWFD